MKNQIVSSVLRDSEMFSKQVEDVWADIYRRDLLTASSWKFSMVPLEAKKKFFHSGRYKLCMI